LDPAPHMNRDTAPIARQLYGNTPVIWAVLRGVGVTAYVLAVEIAWDCRYNPQWTRFWN
ncbi:MAG: hypothetical protein JWP56_3103, partial [Aeromicrobium sp.]|nr:hypothetical protein [Aeromicrobium sp.]